mmetsp:Transcript_9554/g.10758  ORF Transcript_9554/g.10758 Transcript_9554/m.10758 type:complete len:254 (-) Transcript_9554:213-974(-)
MYGNYTFSQVQSPFTRLAATPIMTRPYIGSYTSNNQLQSNFIPQVQSSFGFGNNLFQPQLSMNPANIDLAMFRLKSAEATNYGQTHQYQPTPLNLTNLQLSPPILNIGAEYITQSQQMIQTPRQADIAIKVGHDLPLSKEDSETTDLVSKTEFETESLEPADKIITSKKIKKELVCGHTNKPHYAKGLCNNCYHKHGRTKKPWLCKHDKLYAHGLCQKCYKRANRRNLLTDSVKTQIKNSSIAILNFSNVESP